MGTHPIFESDFDCLTEMAKSLRSKRARKNRKIQAEKKAPRILKKMKDSIEAAQQFNAMRDAEKEKENEKIGGVEMENVESREKVEDDAMEEKSKLNLKTGLNTDGSRPVWMSHKKFKKTKLRLKARTSKFTPNKFGIGPHKKVT